ncbi:glycosyltransferase family 4 protein [Chitinophaga sp. G-6-1-13]|uniref:Glycosyltransferase family 4 protein n=1 Tax=Chitinophaga fulva TaxID=2728842 RepID=A0A848GKP1_9BACT|nr:glycosyltransferase family 4 protein [Chitinophaga fulva]NML37270.1 glycosyltransferase family 4 protein [Chitinophaga fulva]
MKVLIIHNEYGKYSGEEAVVDQMGQMLQNNGHEVGFFRRTTAGLRESLTGQVKVFFSGIYSYQGVHELRKELKRFCPDVINIHNLYPFISPAALFECKAAKIPVVMTVHNYRLICPTGLFMRDGKPCEHCLEHKNEWGCIRFNCEGSRLKSVAYALRGYVARKWRAYHQNVDRYICLTSFQKSKLIQAGFDEEKIAVIPNSINTPGPYEPATGNYVAYSGRFSYEKGWDMLIDIARKHPEISFCLAGQKMEAHLHPVPIPANVVFRGFLDKQEMADFYRNARFLIVPSRVYEGFPLSLLEAISWGKPIIAPNHAGFHDIVGSGDEAIGYLFTPGDINDLEAKITILWNNPHLTWYYGRKSFAKFTAFYESTVVYQQWNSLFTSLLK